MVCYFIISIVNSMAQSYAKRLQQLRHSEEKTKWCPERVVHASKWLRLCCCCSWELPGSLATRQQTSSIFRTFGFFRRGRSIVCQWVRALSEMYVTSSSFPAWGFVNLPADPNMLLIFKLTHRLTSEVKQQLDGKCWVSASSHHKPYASRERRSSLRYSLTRFLFNFSNM